MPPFQPVRLLHCEAKGHVFLLSTWNFRHSDLQVTSSHANCTPDWSLNDMAMSAHTYLLIGHVFSHWGLNLYSIFFSQGTLKYMFEF